MQCPYCDGDSSVTETRLTEGGLRRRRVCSACRRRFTTYEKVGSPGLRVDKRAGGAEPFDADKLLRCLTRVARGRGLSPESLRRLARDIEGALLDGGRARVRWDEIVTLALARLEGVDALAAQRLRANYLDEAGRLRFDATAAAGAERPRRQLGLPGVDE